MQTMITMTDSAVAKITDIIAEENNPNIKLRTFVQGGGCSGFSYGFTLDEEHFVIDQPGLTVIVDSMSMQYLQGAVIDYKEEINGSSFVITNPNAQSTCGCGSSFSV